MTAQDRGRRTAAAMTLGALHTEDELGRLARSLSFPSDYGGDWSPVWATVAAVTRDTEDDSVAMSNYVTAARLLRIQEPQGENESWRLNRKGHWGYGFIDLVEVSIIPPDWYEAQLTAPDWVYDKYAQVTADMLRPLPVASLWRYAVTNIVRPLADYPVLDESDLSAREWAGVRRYLLDTVFETSDGDTIQLNEIVVDSVQSTLWEIHDIARYGDLAGYDHSEVSDWVSDALNDMEDESRCPACGDPIDYCQGHGEIGDPAGARILAAHYDEDEHGECHPDGCDHARARQ